MSSREDRNALDLDIRPKWQLLGRDASVGCVSSRIFEY